MEAAKKYWMSQPKENKIFENAPAFFDQLIEFYSNFGFVPKSKYDELLKEKEKLEKENKLLKDTIQQLNMKVMTEGSVKLQETWKEIIDKQTELSKEIAKSFFEIFKHTTKK
ncbi:MAG: hypothetical protein D6828_03840 [Nitrospirae bacterium]|nr:MAG: hypothetical protein D6828_03840 [Nitrospirota bacterium]